MATVCRIRLITVSDDLVSQRVVGQHEPVAQHVRNDLDDVLRHHVVTPAHKRQCTRRGDDAQ